MTTYRLGQAAELLGVSADTVRRWADNGRLATGRNPSGHRVIDGEELARFAEDLAAARTAEPAEPRRTSIRNHLPGIVTRVVANEVTAQVELQAGVFRLVAVITREAVEELGLAPGVMAEAVIKATNVSIDRPTE